MTQDDNGFTIAFHQNKPTPLCQISAHTCMLFHNVKSIYGMYVSMGISMTQAIMGFTKFYIRTSVYTFMLH